MSLFKNIVLDDGAYLQGLVAFIICSVIFGFITYRAWTMRRDDEEHTSSLPLENDTESTSSHTTKP